jgi:uncharacterized SAM-binding protein YcdF (DUF218 family)
MRHLSAIWQWLMRLAACIGIAFLLVTFTPLVFWWATALAGPWNDPDGDVLIVLTGSVLDERTIGMNSYWRAVSASHVFLDEHFQEMIISGGGGDATPSAVSMRDFVIAQGVAPSAVHLEVASRNTHDSAGFVGALLRADPGRYASRRLVLLTSDYHMFRSSRVFRRAGVMVAPRPIPDARKRYRNFLDRWGIFWELLIETAKIGYYWTRGWI